MKRIDLHEKFREISPDFIGPDGKAESRVYYETPDNLKMKFPCIRYERVRLKTTNADDMDYFAAWIYRVFILTTDPDSDMPMKVKALPFTSLKSAGVVNGLHQTVIEITH